MHTLAGVVDRFFLAMDNVSKPYVIKTIGFSHPCQPENVGGTAMFISHKVHYVIELSKPKKKTSFRTAGSGIRIEILVVLIVLVVVAACL